MRIKFYKVIIILATLTVIGLILGYFLTKNYVFDSSIARYRLVEITRHKNVTKKVILFYTNFFGIRHWGMPNETNGEEYLKSIECPQTNCIFTHDKNYLSKTHFYDAIVFHVAEGWYALDLPKTRSSHQLYVASTLE